MRGANEKPIRWVRPNESVEWMLLLTTSLHAFAPVWCEVHAATSPEIPGSADQEPLFSCRRPILRIDDVQKAKRGASAGTEVLPFSSHACAVRASACAPGGRWSRLAESFSANPAGSVSRARDLGGGLRFRLAPGSIIFFEECQYQLSFCPGFRESRISSFVESLLQPLGNRIEMALRSQPSRHIWQESECLILD